MRSTYSALALCGCMCAGACAESHGDDRPPPMSTTTIDASTADVTALCLSDLGHALAWDEPGSWGTTPAEAFSDLEGSCSAPYRWLFEQNTRSSDPVSSEGQLTISVTPDRESARNFSEHSGCHARIEAQALVQVTTADGLLNERGIATLRRGEGTSRAASAALEIPAQAIEGTLRLISSAQPLHLRVQSRQVDEGCEGTFLVGVSDPRILEGAFRIAFNAGGWSLSPPSVP